MINILKNILETITLLINLLLSIITALINFIINIPKYLNLLISLLGIAPTFVYSFAILGLTLNIILFMINRKSNQGGN